jgi:hypothetical protein
MYKKLIVFSLILISAYSCIKRPAIKTDPGLIGTWVANDGEGVYSWLIIDHEGRGNYSTLGNNEGEAVGEVKYSLFERKMWVGDEKFKVTVWRSGRLDGVGELKTKEYKTLKDTTYAVEEKMVLKTGALGRSIDFYKIKD